jgi:hypothetical protein
MKSRRLIKKYKNKSRSRKTRRRVLKGGVPHGSRHSSRPPSSSVRPPSSVRPSSRASSRPSSRPSSRAGIFKPPVPLKCCEHKSVLNQEKILSTIDKFPHEFDTFFQSLLTVPDDDLPITIQKFKPSYIKAITLQPQGAYLNINGLKFINYLRSKYVNLELSSKHKEKIDRIISLLDQYGAAPGIRNSDLKVIEKNLDKRYFECYKKLYDYIFEKLFKCKNKDCYPVSTSAISLYCKPETVLTTIPEE